MAKTRMYTELPHILKDAGLPVNILSGAETRAFRGIGLEVPVKSILIHHDATKPKNNPSAIVRLLSEGYAGLPGPLCQLHLARSGDWWHISSGLANHSGKVKDPKYSGYRAIGIEASNDGLGEPWPDHQYESYYKGVAALMDGLEVPIEDIVGHKEAAYPQGRKIDPTFDMNQFRLDVLSAAKSSGKIKWEKPKSESPRYLRPYMEHKKVGDIQTWLSKHFSWAKKELDAIGGVDNKYGDGTAKVVAEFQKRANHEGPGKWDDYETLDVDGKWGPKTESAAKKFYGFGS